MVFVFRGFLCGRRLLRLRLAAMPVPFHTLGKLADMVEIAAHLGMAFVNETAGLFRLFSPRIVDNDFPAIGDAEQLFVMGVYKVDSLFRSGYMLIEPFFHIAVAVKVIVALCRVATEQESVFVSIYTEAVLSTVIPHKGGIGGLPCSRRHITAAVQKPLIFTQGVDYIVKPCLKFIGFPLFPCVRPIGMKLVSRAAKVPTEMTDAPRLPLKLHTLGVGVFLFGLRQSPYLHQRSSLLFDFFAFSCSLIFASASFAQTGIFSGLISPSTSHRSHRACLPSAREVPNTACPLPPNAP